MLSNDCPSRTRFLKDLLSFDKQKGGCFARRQKGERLGGGTSNISFFREFSSEYENDLI